MEKFLDINIREFELIIREAFLKVIGENYRNVVNRRLDKAIYIHYNNFRGLKDYREYLLQTKRDILLLEFLKEIGYDTGKFDSIHNDSAHYQEFETIVEMFLGAKVGFNLNRLNTGLFSFKNPDDKFNKLVALNFQIEFINNYLFSESDIIDENNYEEFKKTDVYKRLIKKVEEWLPLLDEKKRIYQEYKKTLEHLKIYASEKENRLAYIHEQNRLAIYKHIEKELPEEWLELLKNKYDNDLDRSRILGEIDELFGFDIFSYKYDSLLKFGNTDEKNAIMSRRIIHLEKLGYLSSETHLSTPNIDCLYENVFKNPDAQKYIPSASLIKKLQSLKEELIKESEKELLLEDYYFQKLMREKRYAQETAEDIAKKLADTPILVSNGTCNDVDFTFLYFTIRCFEGGMLDCILVHEFIHLFEVFLRKSGVIFSGFDFLLTTKKDKNPYNEKYRLYERLNETLVDLLTQDVLHVLHDEFKIYMLEDKSVVKSSINKNTNSILKNLVYPFYHEYFDLIIEAFMKEDLNIIFSVVGRENFLKLVDIVNYVDNLISNHNISDDIENMNEQTLFYKIYLLKVEEIINLYEKMHEFKDNQKRH